MESPSEKKRKKFRDLYEILFNNYRMPAHRISKKLGIWSVSSLIEEARRLQIIVGPEIRKLACENTLEHVTLFNAEDPDLAYWRNCEDPRVIYHAQMSGFCNSLVISREEIDVDGEVTLKGPRSNYWMPYTPDRSWEHALQIMREKIRDFDPDACTSSKLIGNQWKETVKWNNTDEILYRYFKYDLRKKVGPLIKEQHIPKSTIYAWLETLDKRCTIRTSYYPEGLPEYDTYFYLFETMYERFIVELFSELPASPSFFKVADAVLLTAYIPRRFMRNIDLREAEKWFIPLLETELVNKGIVKKKKRAIDQTVQRFYGVADHRLKPVV